MSSSLSSSSNSRRNEDPVDALYVNTENNDYGKKRHIDRQCSELYFYIVLQCPAPEEAQLNRLTREVTTQLLNEHERHDKNCNATCSLQKLSATATAATATTDDNQVVCILYTLPLIRVIIQPRFKVMPKNIARTISDSVPGSRVGSPAFQLYDAVREQQQQQQQSDSTAMESERIRREIADELNKEKQEGEEEGEDGMPDDMNSFIALLRDHLTLNDIPVPEESEFVYDFYYDDIRPIQHNPAHAATLIWLDAVDKEAFGENGFDSDNQEESSESEDSNAEDHYANDYPEENEDESEYENESDEYDDDEDEDYDADYY
ncbi:hypothetical protein BDF22DRAFT_691589 [Syncephalis plumigaleata]|nr:hypothetical protein BDF22DRAFT_691589 [Syncephalis plumigaleata]